MVVDSLCDGSADFTALLPFYVTEEIFSGMDVCSVCRSTEVSRDWYSLINGSTHIWRNLCHNLNGNMHRYTRTVQEWKFTAKQMYKTNKCKTKWLKGTFSHIKSYADLKDSNSFCKLSKEDWGDILQMELAR